MKAEKLQIEYVAHGSNFLENFDGVRHTKTLDCLSVVQSVQGTYEISLSNGKAHFTKPKGFFVSPSNVQQTIVHHADIKTKQMDFRWLFIKIKVNGLYSFDSLYDFPVILPECVQNKMNAVFDDIFNTDNIYKQYSNYYRVAEILLEIATQKSMPIDKNIPTVIAFINSHYNERISVGDMAKQVALSESRFYSVFKKALGVSPIAYLNNYRLSLAADRLIATNSTVTEISYSVGIDDPVYFNKLFKKAYQISPTQYRKTYKKL